MKVEKQIFGTMYGPGRDNGTHTEIKKKKKKNRF